MVSNLVIYIISFLSIITIVPFAVWFYFWNKSFIHTVFIAKQSGRDVSDVLWVRDQFKIIERNGVHVIAFKRHKGKSPSFSGDFWCKVFKNNGISIDDDVWKKISMPKMIGRGLFLYQNTEGEFHPITLSIGSHHPEFKVLTQDNRAFIVQGLRETQALTLTAKKQVIAIVAVVIAILVLAVLFFLFLMYLTEAATNICGRTGTTFMQTAQGVVGG